LVYSTAEVLSHSLVDGQSILVLWLPEGEAGEFSIHGGSKRREVVSGTGGSFHTVGDDLVVAYTQHSTQAVLQFDTFRVVLLSQELAYRLWAPPLTLDPLVPAGQVLLVTGPYLVRSARIEGPQVSLTGDLDAQVPIDVWSPRAVTGLTWNGKSLPASRTSYGTLKARSPTLAISTSSIQQSLTFGEWKYSDAIPEAQSGYDDSNWVIADHLTTFNPTPPQTLPVLYADDYGFHTGAQLFRGRFRGNDSTGVSLNIQGGTAFGWSAWLNGAYIGSFPGVVASASNNMNLSFANATLFPLGETENVLTVVMDHSGHDQRSDALLPRGILGASLLSESNDSFSSWRIAGNAGGESNIDPVRGVIAEGGLHAERLGWHLPGFDDSHWIVKSPSEGVQNGTIGFFRTTANVNIPEGYDASLQFIIQAKEGSLLRAQLYVNGYQYGKYVPQIGNQIAFPVIPGILNYRGNNTIGLSLWAQQGEGAEVDISWDVLGVYESAFDCGFDAQELQPPWTEERLRYA